ncbi:MAG: DUF3382 domain-containing protein, partial [Rhizobiales bacterium]|nr:DUF3382 domain-containing protein [Hyphomicrobiales bacterium]
MAPVSGSDLADVPAPSPVLAEKPRGPERTSAVAGALKDALVSGLLTALLFLPLVGFRASESSTGSLVLTYRFGLVAIFAGIVMVGRFLLMVTVWNPNRPPRRVSTTPGVMARLGALASPAVKPVFFSFAILYPFLSILLAGGLSPSRYWVDLGIYVLTYVMLGWGLNIVVGLAGLLDLGYVAFYAVGAYTFALLSTSVPINDFFAGTLGDIRLRDAGAGGDPQNLAGVRFVEGERDAQGRARGRRRAAVVTADRVGGQGLARIGARLGVVGLAADRAVGALVAAAHQVEVAHVHAHDVAAGE